MFLKCILLTIMILGFIAQVFHMLVNSSLIQLEAMISHSQKSHSYN